MSVVLDLVDETLHEVTLVVEVSVIVSHGL
jgi:hypothetical protein